MKNKAIILGMALIMATSVASAQAQQSGVQNVIEVNASAQEKVMPNKILVQITVSQDQSKGKVELSTLVNSVIQAVKASGLDPEKALKVSSQSSDYGKKTTVLGYKTFIATVGSGEQANQLFTELSGRGIADSRIISVSHTDMDAIVNRVKAQAIVNAKNTAQTVAEAIGQKIGQAVNISVMNYGPRNYAMPVMYAKAQGYVSADMSSETNLDFQDITVEQNVSAKFLLF